ALYNGRDSLKSYIAEMNQHVVDLYNKEYAFDPAYLAEQKRLAQIEEERLAKLRVEQERTALLNQFTLGPTDEIFFAGDSLMQGVAPHVQKFLQEKYQINSVNLSKQSTGLAYPSFFNWPETIAEILKTNSNIKVLVVFLGPNDPWDMPSPKGGVYLKFKSTDWEQVYRFRVSNILEVAKQHGVAVMWLGAPNMKKSSLDEQMMYLNHLIQDEVVGHNALWLDTRSILGSNNNQYSDYLVKNGQSVKMRSGDGIHFSVDGQKEVAQAIESHLHIVK
ncbi:MAG: DUF459 domain-containing protein, partial [Acinetobacter sp.]